MSLFSQGKKQAPVPSRTQLPGARPMRTVIDSDTLRMGRCQEGWVPEFTYVPALPGLKSIIPCGCTYVSRSQEKAGNQQNSTTSKLGKEQRETHAKLALSKTPFALLPEDCNPPALAISGTQASMREWRHATRELCQTPRTLYLRTTYKIAWGLALSELERALCSRLL